MTISEKIESFISNSSWIRKMFEQGALLKEEYGAENVFDFSLGNPNLPPPDLFKKELQKAANDTQSGIHGYMPNTGYPEVRKSVANFLSTEQESPVSEENIIMTCGAAGALNVILKTILDPKDEVIVPSPYFVEYNFYVDNHGGKLIPVPTNPDFTLDIKGIAENITEKTKTVLINSPNNPTGQVYSEESLKELSQVLAENGKKHGRTIYLISDEPYRKIVYDDIRVPGLFKIYNETIIATSYSKDISVPGERVGFIAVNPDAKYKDSLLSGMTLANRILGFVNAPAFMQRIMGNLQGVSVNIQEYSRKKDALCKGLAEFGYEFTPPAGAFYLFPRSPVEDDVKFVNALLEEKILAVPGSGFGGPGHFRLAFCVDDNTIKNAMPGFKRAIKQFV